MTRARAPHDRCRRSAALAWVLWIAAWTTALAAPASAGDVAPTERTELRAGEDLPVTANHFQEVHAHNSPELAVDPTDPRFVVLASRLDAPDFGCALHLSGDRGGRFVPAQPVPELPQGAEACYAPEVAFGPDGTLHYLFVGLAGEGNTPMGVFLTSSDDRGRSFSEPVRILGPNSFAVRMAVDRTVGDRGRLHVVWLAAQGDPSLGSLPPPPNPIMAMHSDDGGATFSEPVQVSDPDRERVVAPALTVGPDRRVHVAYYDLGDDARDYHGLEGPVWEGHWSLVVATSHDGGASFDHGVAVDDAIVPPERVMLIFTMAPPAVAADHDRGVFVAWHDARNGDWDAWLRRSSDAGATWQAPVRLNDDELGNGRHQYQPQLAVSPAGRIDVTFYDRRDDPDNLRNHVSYTSSDDGGDSFAANLRVTSAASDTRIGQRYAGPAAEGMVEFGSRQGLLATDDRTVAAWTDTRNAARSRQQDIFAAVVEHQAGGPGASVWIPAGLTVAIGGAALGIVLLRRRRAVALAAVVAVTGCSSAAGAPLPRPPAELEVTMREYGFEHADSLPSGRALVRVDNAGTVDHQLVLVRLPDDLEGTFVEQLHSDERRSVETLTVLRLSPGQGGVFAVDLGPGRYGFACFLKTPEGEIHALEGMNSELQVTDRSG